nr:zinc ABC transporter substrate-binding protein [Rhodococcus sp. SORGH_AS_0301]
MMRGHRTGSLLAAVAVAVVALLAGCSATADDRPVVMVSTNILGDVVEELVGDEAEVVTLMKPNADPHSFEISAQEGARLRSADLVVSNGLGLEEGLQQHLDAAAAEKVPTFVAGDVIDVLDYREGDAAGSPDSHFWTDPARMIAVVDALEPVLGDLDGVESGHHVDTSGRVPRTATESRRGDVRLVRRDPRRTACARHQPPCLRLPR